MFKELGLRIDNILSKTEMNNLDTNLLVSILNKFCTDTILTSDKKMDYGRYLAYKSDICNIQVDIFSEGYKGQIHNHNTWGIIGIIQGNFIISDYSITSEKLIKIRSVFAPKGLVSFFPAISDIHSLESIEGVQGLTVHVYGKDFDIDTGMRYIQKSGIWEKYQRSELKKFNEIESNFIIMGK